LFICCAAAFGCYFGTYMRMPVVPLYAQSLGASPVAVGLINASFLLTAGGLSFPAGLLADRWGAKFLVAFGTAVLAASSLALGVGQTPSQLMLISLAAGVGFAAFGPTLMTLVANFTPATHLGRAYGWYTTALYTGMSLGPATGGWVAQAWGPVPSFYLAGLALIIMLALVLAFLPKPSPLLPRPEPHPHLDAGSRRLIIHNRPLLGAWLATLGGCFGLGMFLTVLPLHAHLQGLTVQQIGMVFAVQGLVNAATRFPFGHLSDHCRDRRSLVVWGVVGIAASEVGLGAARHLTEFLVGAVAMGVSMGLAFTSIGALIAETVAPENRGLAMGGYNTCIYLGMMASSALMGPAIERWGYQAGFAAAGGVLLLSLVGFRSLMRHFSPPPRV
jgi:MFS family permease